MPYKNKEDAYAWHKKWRDENSESINQKNKEKYSDNPLPRMSATMKYKYGITYEDYLRMLEEQGGVCAICGTDKPGGRGKFHIDHDHSCCPTEKTCGKCVRGLLCARCNTKLGVIESLWIMKGLAYLQKWVILRRAERCLSITRKDTTNV